MFATRKYLYIHIPKTGGKAVQLHFLNTARPQYDSWRFLPGHVEEMLILATKKHGLLREYNRDGILTRGGWWKMPDRSTAAGGDRRVFCNMRNPWDWHVSEYYHNFLYGSGVRSCLRKLKYNIKSQNDQRMRKKHHELNKNYMNKETFSDYIKYRYSESHGCDERPLLLPNTGHLTGLYFDMCSKKDLPSWMDPALLFDKHDEIIGVNKIIRMEDMPEALNKYMGVPLDLKFKQVVSTSISSGLHSLSMHRDHYSCYYDDEARKIVEKKEAFIIKKLNYKFQKGP